MSYDLTRRVLDAIEAKEAKARAVVGTALRYTTSAEAAFLADNGPGDVLSRCLADRELVALLALPPGPHRPDEHCETCQALHILARYYRVQP